MPSSNANSRSCPDLGLCRTKFRAEARFADNMKTLGQRTRPVCKTSATPWGLLEYEYEEEMVRARTCELARRLFAVSGFYLVGHEPAPRNFRPGYVQNARTCFSDRTF